jgi:hypothetical protein
MARDVNASGRPLLSGHHDIHTVVYFLFVEPGLAIGELRSD